LLSKTNINYGLQSREKSLQEDSRKIIWRFRLGFLRQIMLFAYSW